MNQTLNCSEAILFLRRYKRECFTSQLRTTGTPHSVNIVLGHCGNVEVDNVTKRFDIDTP